MTLGMYLLSQESTTHFMVLDADSDNGFNQLAELAKSLNLESVPTYLEMSRRGGHLWFFFKNPLPGSEVRAFGQGILQAHKLKDIELYPKQDILGDGPGSLIRLPFGTHQISKRRYPFVYPNGDLLAEAVREQVRILAAPETVSPAKFETYARYLPPKNEKPLFRVLHNATDALSGDIKDRISVLDFVSQFVDLKPTASGAVGCCLFHEDKHPSFGVNTKGNYWHCFAGCGGGSIIDFWMKWKNTDFSSAITELNALLGDERRKPHKQAFTIFENSTVHQGIEPGILFDRERR